MISVFLSLGFLICKIGKIILALFMSCYLVHAIELPITLFLIIISLILTFYYYMKMFYAHEENLFLFLELKHNVKILVFS